MQDLDTSTSKIVCISRATSFKVAHESRNLRNGWGEPMDRLQVVSRHADDRLAQDEERGEVA